MSLKVKEAFEILKEEGITSHIESVRRWIRTGELKAFKSSSKKGYNIKKEELQRFIEMKKHENQVEYKFVFSQEKEFKSKREEVQEIKRQMEELRMKLAELEASDE